MALRVLGCSKTIFEMALQVLGCNKTTFFVLSAFSNDVENAF